MGISAQANRHAGWVKVMAVVLLLVSFVVIARALPMTRLIEQMSQWVDDQGALGPLVYGLVYIVAAVALVPGSAITLASGVIFGLFWGFVIVSIASTTGAALSFLIGRYVARDRIRRTASRNPRFKAVDEAIAEKGWKIVFLLRLSPVFPYSIGNYLFGLTGVRLLPYVVASWIGMMPGTFLYVYLGYAGLQGISAASGGAGGPTTGEWVLLGVGLVATLVVTVYVTLLAASALRRGTHIVEERDEPVALDAEVGKEGWPWGATVLAVTSVLMMTGAVYAQVNREAISDWFGPPAVVMTETHQDGGAGARVNHSIWNELVGAHVAEGGWVNYEAFRKNEADLDAYISQLEAVDFKALGRDEKLALLINAYNAFTVRLILDYWRDGALQSINDIPALERWKAARWRVGSNTWSLDQIEHEQIRANFKEPRIHFALVCAAVGCPPLRSQAYTGARLNEQLEDQTRYCHAHERWLALDDERSVASLTKLYDWYGDDFLQVADSVLSYAAGYAEPLKAALDAGRELQVDWLDYDWRLNSRENAR